MPKQDYYTLLGVSPNAAPEEISKAYKRLANQYHPDKATGDAKKFKAVAEAFRVLNDPEQRKIYDRGGHAGDTICGGRARTGAAMGRARSELCAKKRSRRRGFERAPGKTREHGEQMLAVRLEGCTRP